MQKYLFCYKNFKKREQTLIFVAINSLNQKNVFNSDSLLGAHAIKEQISSFYHWYLFIENTLIKSP